MQITKLSEDYHRKLWGKAPRKLSKVAELMLAENLEPWGLYEFQDPTVLVELPLPEWALTAEGTLEEALELFKPRLDRLDALACQGVPELPSSLPKSTGWSKVVNGGWIACDLPSDRAFVLDVEAYNHGGIRKKGPNGIKIEGGTWYPTVAVALVDQDWFMYRWVAPAFNGDSWDFSQTAELMPGCTDSDIVGHNICYDRQWLANEYLLESTGNYFSDTRSMWVVTRGMCDQQRVVKAVLDKEEVWLPWTEETATNSLADLAKFYLGEELDKSTRDEGLLWSTAETIENWERTALYCAKDVLTTLEVYQKLWPEYCRRRSETSRASALFLSTPFLPLSPERFPGFWERVEARYKADLQAIQDSLDSLAQELLGQDPEVEPRLDWTRAKSGKNKGLPAWYRDWRKNPSINTRTAHYLLDLHWKDEPIAWDRGWVTASGPVPHPEGNDRVTSLFIKGFSSAVEAGLLTAKRGDAITILKTLSSLLNWKSMRGRVRDIKAHGPEGFPVCLPQIAPNGTVTGRGADTLWLVVCNPKKDRVGTELKSLVEAPKGWSMVGADVDSEELWLASLLGDMRLGICGSTPLGLMTLAGDKATKTDPHSVLAKQANTDRGLAKTIWYGMIYGLGEQGVVNRLVLANPGVAIEELRVKAQEIMGKAKGRKVLGAFAEGLASDTFNTLDSRAKCTQPETFILGNKISLSLSLAGKDFKTTRVNWQIQAAGADFRDLLVVYVCYFAQKLGLTCRFVILPHDELRLIVLEGQEVLAAYVLQLAHLYTRSYILRVVGADCIPANIAWFSGVDVDKVLRKDPSEPQVTPTQLEPIVPGQTWSPKDLLEKLTASSLEARLVNIEG